jgi:hypothetical protein
MYVNEKRLMYRVRYYPRFRASAVGLGTYHPRIRGDYCIKKLVKCYIWSIALYGAESWTRRKVDQKCLESFEKSCLRRMEKISWTDRVRNDEVLYNSQGGQEYPTYSKKKAGQ